MEAHKTFGRHKIQDGKEGEGGERQEYKRRRERKEGEGMREYEDGREIGRKGKKRERWRR